MVEQRPHIWSMGWTPDYPDPDDFLRVCLGRASVYADWRDERFLAILEEARRSTDHGRRLAVYEEAEKILAVEVPILPVSYFRHHWLVKPWIRRMPLSPLKWWHWNEVIIEPH